MRITRLSFFFILVSMITSTTYSEIEKNYIVERQALKMNYQLQTQRIFPQQIGLEYNQAWVIPFSDITYQQIKEAKNYDEYLLKSAIQGLINRHGPMIYMDKGGFWGRTEVDQW